MQVFPQKYIAVFCLTLLSLTAATAADQDALPADVEVLENKSPIRQNDTAADIVKFNNNDVLHGGIVSLSNDSLIWDATDAEGVITFKTANINEIVLGKRSGDAMPSALSYVVLTNGDTLGGKILNLNADSLVMETPYAGELKIERAMIRSIYPAVDGSDLIYQGPKNLSEWESPGLGKKKKKIAVREGKLILEGYAVAGRDLQLPDRSKIQFDLESDRHCQIQVYFYADLAERRSSCGYLLFFSSSGYMFLQNRRNGRSENLGNLRENGFDSKKKNRITILSDKANKTVALLVNNELKKEWQDSAWCGDGGSVTFMNSSNNQVVISDISVSKWNGKKPGGVSKNMDKNKDSAALINDDIIDGHLKSIDNGKILFTTEYADLELPLARVRYIITSEDSRHRARRCTEDIRCFFNNGDSVTFALENIKDGMIEGKSDNFGQHLMKLTAFSRIKFHIYDEE